ncbi:hypothetical protein [Virgibacillus pantothenticus]|uniref:hypothetical protein n=1 Tax=Virgibacillus pantothenticus TaxID=1473 RepID=UPI000985F2D2|nr:hypothetical protein [Virgibacillus pantothenticus]
MVLTISGGMNEKLLLIEDSLYSMCVAKLRLFGIEKISKNSFAAFKWEKISSYKATGLDLLYLFKL